MAHLRNHLLLEPIIYDDNLGRHNIQAYMNEMKMELEVMMKKKMSQNSNYEEILLAIDTHRIVAHIPDNADEFFFNFSYTSFTLLVFNLIILHFFPFVMYLFQLYKKIVILYFTSIIYLFKI